MAVQPGSTREFWLANITDSTPQWSFLEDSYSSTKRPAELGRTIRLGSPIDTGPNSNWKQKSWQGGTLQDVWSDDQMYQKGDVNALTETGKIRMWPGLKSIFQGWNFGPVRGFSATQSSSASGLHERSQLYVAFGDYWPWDDTKQATYSMWRLDPAFDGNNTPGKAANLVTTSTQGHAYRNLVSVMADDYSGGVIMATTESRMYMFTEYPAKFIEDTAGAHPANQGKYAWNSMVGFNEALYYLHGQRLWKRVPKPPYGVLGTHTVVKALPQSHYLRGLVVWNNRLWFGVHYPNGTAAVYVSDGATSTKAFDFPNEMHIFNLATCAGALYIQGLQASSPLGRDGGLVQQVWRYDGATLKKLWQEGQYNDGIQHWPTGLAQWNGNMVWGSSDGGRARFIIYDPINDAIIEGPGLDKDVANTGGLYIQGITEWNNTIVGFFRDLTNYGAGKGSPGMVVQMRELGAVRNDFRANKSSFANQFNDAVDAAKARDESITSSIYVGDDSVSHEKKTLISATVTYKCTGTHAKIDLYIIQDEGTPTFIATLTNGGNSGWQTVTVPIKANGTGQYLQATRWQYKLRLYNDDTGNYASTDEPWVDDVNISYMIASKKRRSWQLRVPVFDTQARLDGSNNPLNTEQLLAQKLEDLYFAGLPVKFWEPNSSGGTPGGGATCEAFITQFQRQENRLDTTGSSQVGSVSITLVENVIA